MARRLSELQIQHISLVKAGANNRVAVLKSASGEPEGLRLPIRKELRGVAYSIVYAPEELDAHEDLASAEEIVKAAYGYMANGRPAAGVGVDYEHNGVPGESFVAESWIVRKGDPLFPDEPEGSWAVGIKLSAADLERWQSGEFEAVSMGGYGKTEALELAKGRLADAVKQRDWEAYAWAFVQLVDSVTRSEDPDKKGTLKDAAEELAGLFKSQTKATDKERPMNRFQRMLKGLGFKGSSDVIQGFTAELETVGKAADPVAALEEAFQAAKAGLEAYEATPAELAELQKARDTAKAELDKSRQAPPATPDLEPVLKAALAPVLKSLGDLQASITGLESRLEIVEKSNPGPAAFPFNGGQDGEAIITSSF